MGKYALALCALVLGCGSNDDSPAGTGAAGGGGSSSCPSLAATWKVATHCDSSLVGMDAVVKQSGCRLSFAPPFDGFTGNVSAEGDVTLSGPQTCTGSATADSINLVCTPGTCDVVLAR